jgi:hypothetical protein
VSFKKSVRKGNLAETFVKDFFQKLGVELERNPSKSRAEMALWDLRGTFGQTTFTLEVKWDVMAGKTGNLAVEFYNTRSGKPSGIMATTSDLWVVLTGEEMNGYVARTSVLREYFEKNKGVRDVAGGDNNSAMRLFRADEILKDVFWPMDCNLKHALRYLLS